MTQENDKTRSALEQIVAHALENLKAVEELQKAQPDYSEDLEAIRCKQLEAIGDLTNLADSVKVENGGAQ